MGLKTDIYDAYEKLMSNGGQVELSEDILNNLDIFTAEFVEAIKVFLTKQTWQITDMQAFVELDEFETSIPTTADVMPTVMVTPGQAIANGFGPGATTAPGILQGTSKGISVPAIKFSKNGTQQGGQLKGIGHAYLGNPTTSPSLFDEFDTKGDNDGWNQLSKVKLNYNDIEADE